MTQKKHPMRGNRNAYKGHGEHLRMRCKPEDKAAWLKHSQKQNVTLTAWVAETLNNAIRGQHE